MNLLKRYHQRTEFVGAVSASEGDSFENSEVFTDAVEVDDGDLRSILITINSSILETKLCHLSSVCRSDFEKIIAESKHVFSDVPGLADVDSHVIRLKPNAKIVKLPPYRMSIDLQSKLRKEIQNLLDEGLVETTESEWCSPAFVVPKPDKSIRVVIDYRKFNLESVGDGHPLPRIDDLIQIVEQATILTKFDLTKGFYQIPVDKEFRKYTVFCTPFGIYKFTRLPFGLKVCPQKFQSILNRVLAGLESFCVIYIDDIVIFSKTWSDHLIHVREVLKRLAQYRFTVKLMKCLFALAEIDFVGHTGGAGKMSPRDAKVKALLAMPRPTTKKQLQSFVGLANYFSRYIHRFSELAIPLTTLLRKNVAFSWTTEADNSYESIKEILAKSPILYVADNSKPFFIFTDASNDAVGSALCQFSTTDNLYHPVCYHSHKLNKTEKNYSVTDREALALVDAVRTFKGYLPMQFTVYSDHEPLTFINRMAAKNQRIMR